MAKKSTILVKLVSSEDTGYFIVKKRNPKQLKEKLTLRKYDPVVRKHVVFNEKKMSG
jgi:large subunit ribosomal protein L33